MPEPATAPAPPLRPWRPMAAASFVVGQLARHRRAG